MDSNILVYAVVDQYPDEICHQKCLLLLEQGLRGKLNFVLALNPIIVVEAFSALRKLLTCNEAEFRVGSLLRSNRLAFLSISKEACQNSVRWAREKNVPVNDAIIGANMIEQAQLIYTADEEHFRKLEEYGVKITNPLRA
jgi:predicted nucleic acid-binding protein